MKDSSIFRDKAAWAVCGISSIFLLNVLLTPVTFDNAIVQSMALDLYRLGRIPFLGSWDQSFPGIVYVYYVAILLFGTSDFALHLFEALLQLSFTVFLYRFWSRWLRPHTAALAAILYILYYVGANRWLYGTRDIYVAMSILASLSFLLPKIESRSMPRLITASFFAGFALLLRPTSLLFLGIISLSLLFQDGINFTIRNLSRSALFFAAALLPLAGTMAYYFHLPNGLHQFYLATIRWNLDLYTKIPSDYSSLFAEFARKVFLLGFAIYALSQLPERRKTFFVVTLSKNEGALYGALMVGSLFIIVLMRKFYTYHFAPFFIILIPASAIGIELFITKFTGVLPRHYALCAACLLSTFVAFVPRSPFAFGLALTQGRNPEEFTYLAEYRDSTWGAKQEFAVRQYLELPPNKTGPIEICSYNPFLRLHLDRDFVGKYVVLDPIALRADGDSIGPPRYTLYQLAWQREYMDSLCTRQPKFIIIARSTSWYNLHDPYASFLHYLPGFDSLLTTAYRRDTTIGGFEIYRRVFERE